MCGVAGVFAAEPMPARSELFLDRMLRALRHRGPDDDGVYVNNNTGIAFGATRLAIVGLSKAGVQPLLSSDGRYAIAINGELYGFRETRARLESEGARFSSKSDSEVALHLYQRRGLDFLSELHGEFALAVFDNQRRELVLARDRFGVRPLYFSRVGEALAFGSEVKALFQYPRVERKLSRRAILSHMVNLKLPGQTLFEGVEALQPGAYLRVRAYDGQLQLESGRYWELEFRAEDEALDAKAIEEKTAEVRDTIIRAVRRRLDADVEVGCYLSGGLDSGTILSVASSLSQRPVRSLSLGFDDAFYDERHDAQTTASSACSSLRVVSMGPRQLYGDNYQAAVWFAERPFYNTMAVAKLCLSRMARSEGLKVVLTGEGADELFGGYPAFRQELDPSMQQSMPKEFRDALVPQSRLNHPLLSAAWGLTPVWIQGWLDLILPSLSLLRRGIREYLADYSLVEDLAARLPIEDAAERHPLDIAQYSWTKMQLEAQVLGWSGDRMDMAHSIETRPAFLDQEVADLACTIPPSLRIRDGVEKWILRRSFRDLLPAKLVSRTKFPFLSPPHHTSEANDRELRYLLDRFASPAAIQSTGIFEYDRVQSLLSPNKGQATLRPNQRDILINHVLGLQILHQQFVAHQPPVTLPS